MPVSQKRPKVYAISGVRLRVLFGQHAETDCAFFRTIPEACHHLVAEAQRFLEYQAGHDGIALIEAYQDDGFFHARNLSARIEVRRNWRFAARCRLIATSRRIRRQIFCCWDCLAAFRVARPSAARGAVEYCPSEKSGAADVPAQYLATAWTKCPLYFVGHRECPEVMIFIAVKVTSFFL